jgi:hypothetical protein
MGDNTKYDALLLMMVTGIIEIFNTATGRSFSEQRNFTYQKYINYGDIKSLIVPYAPLVSITSIADASEDVLYAAEDYKINYAAGIIVFQFELPRLLMLTVTGKHGYEEIPYDIGLAVATQTEFLWEKRKSMAKRSSSTARGDVTYHEKVQILTLCNEIIQKYKL